MNTLHCIENVINDTVLYVCEDWNKTSIDVLLKYEVGHSSGVANIFADLQFLDLDPGIGSAGNSS